MYSRSTGEVNSNRVTSSLLRKRTRLPTHAHEVRAFTFEVTDNFGSNVVLPCGAYGPWSGTLDIDLCNESCSPGPALAFLRCKNCSVGHYTQTVRPNVIIPAMLIGAIDIHHFIPLLPTLTLLGHKISAKHNLLASISVILFI